MQAILLSNLQEGVGNQDHLRMLCPLRWAQTPYWPVIPWGNIYLQLDGDKSRFYHVAVSFSWVPVHRLAMGQESQLPSETECQSALLIKLVYRITGGQKAE